MGCTRISLIDPKQFNDKSPPKSRINAMAPWILKLHILIISRSTWVNETQYVWVNEQLIKPTGPTETIPRWRIVTVSGLRLAA